MTRLWRAKPVRRAAKIFYNILYIVELNSSFLMVLSYMGQLELVAPLWALELWSQQLQERSVLLFVDNDSAATNLVKGYSPQPDSSNLVGSFWLTATQLKLHIYIDHVESKSNIADGPSRNSFAEVIRLGGTWTPPKTGTLGGPATLSPFQLAHWNTGGKFRER